MMMMMMIMIINRPSADNRASVFCNRVYQLILPQLLDLSSITQYMYMCKDTLYTSMMVNILNFLYDNIIFNFICKQELA